MANVNNVVSSIVNLFVIGIITTSDDLVPGDIFLIDENLKAVPADAILIGGEIIVDESMLTGIASFFFKNRLTKYRRDYSCGKISSVFIGFASKFIPIQLFKIEYFCWY